jgi:TPR repeat protein
VAYAGFDEGFSAYQKGDYQTALKEFKPLAEQGDIKAQFSLGVMYAHGKGVAQDYQQAIYWYQKAADQGHANAQFNLKGMYNKDKSVAKFS